MIPDFTNIVSLAYSVWFGVIALLVAQKTSLHEATWQTFANFGIAGLITLGTFLMFSWWMKKTINDQREDTKIRMKQSDEDRKIHHLTVERMATRITDLEDKLVQQLAVSSDTHLRIAAALESNTKQMVMMTSMMSQLNVALASRPCAALEMLPPPERKEVVDILHGRAHQVFDGQ